jgi:hypothetical protein
MSDSPANLQVHKGILSSRLRSAKAFFQLLDSELQESRLSLLPLSSSSLQFWYREEVRATRFDVSRAVANILDGHEWR